MCRAWESSGLGQISVQVTAIRSLSILATSLGLLGETEGCQLPQGHKVGLHYEDVGRKVWDQIPELGMGFFMEPPLNTTFILFSIPCLSCERSNICSVN